MTDAARGDASGGARITFVSSESGARATDRGYDGRLDCEFTLALNNRTGKYFLCAEMLDEVGDLIGERLYWRFSRAAPFEGFARRVVGRLARYEVDLRNRSRESYRLLPALRRQRPVAFMDPRECVLHRLRASDVVLCHDVGPITHPQLFDPDTKAIYGLAFERIARARPHMLFVSETTRRAFCALYGEDYPSLAVAYPPIRSALASPETRPPADAPSRFMLCVGSIGTRKNQLRAIRAFALSGLAEEGYVFMLAGAPEPGHEEARAEAARTRGVVVAGYVDDAELRWLYRNASGIVLPSLLEGFGMPAAEAIGYGLTPALSRGGVLEEVAGEGAVYVDPTDVEDIATGFRRLAAMSAQEKRARHDAMRRSLRRFTREAASAVWRETFAAAAQARRRELAGGAP